MGFLRKYFTTILAICWGAALSILAHGLVGWIGIGILGLIIAFIAVRLETEQRAPVGSEHDTGLYLSTLRGLDKMTRAERAAERAEIGSRLRSGTVAKAIGGILIVVGFVGFALFQFPS